MREYVKFLKKLCVLQNHPYKCGDGCCTMDDWYSEWVDIGDEFLYFDVDVTDLEEHVDYKYVE